MRRSILKATDTIDIAVPEKNKAALCWRGLVPCSWDEITVIRSPTLERGGSHGWFIAPMVSAAARPVVYEGSDGRSPGTREQGRVVGTRIPTPSSELSGPGVDQLHPTPPSVATTPKACPQCAADSFKVFPACFCRGFDMERAVFHSRIDTGHRIYSLFVPLIMCSLVQGRSRWRPSVVVYSLAAIMSHILLGSIATCLADGISGGVVFAVQKNSDCVIKLCAATVGGF